MSQAPLPPTTTEQEDKTTAGQRKVNLIWEYTQSIIAVLIVTANIAAALFNVFNGRDADVPVILSSALFMVLGFYLARTNHQAIGGIGATPSQPYIGR
jgi:hypothetical protein